MKMTKAFWKSIPNFEPTEFACKCGCEKECVDMDALLIVALQNARQHFGKAITVTCGHRCQKYNDSLKGSIKNSYHVKKKAADIYIPGKCDTEKGREEVIKWLKKQTGFKYAYHNVGGNHPNMGNAIHVEVK